MDDIGFLIFSQLLGMTQYPGSPFTGNLFKDIIMFLVVPMIFIIIVIFTMTGRVVPGQPRIRILLGIGAFLFIVASGYYPTFAYLAGPYFIFLIFIMGLLFYIFEHFTGSRPSGGGGAAHFVEGDRKTRNLLGVPTINPAQRNYLNQELKKLDQRIGQLGKFMEAASQKPGTGDLGRMSEQYDNLIRERQEIEDKLKHGG